jgi:hypothetical protein
MQHRTTLPEAPRGPVRPVRVLIEDPALLSGALDAPGGFEVVACSGPRDADVCPLVMDGTCPLGPCDVVVTTLAGPWARSVRAAWQEAGAVVVDTVDVVAADPNARLSHHVGAAIQRLWPSGTTEERRSAW